ncbi:MAG: signal peptidase I [Candidatus Hydrogenedentota bacterium]
MNFDVNPDKPVPRPAPEKPANIKTEAVELIKLVAWFLLLFFALKYFVIEGYEVQGPSMEPTLWNNERILVFKLPHKLSQLGILPGYDAVTEGDIVVFERTEDGRKRYVKRVIAKGPDIDSNTVGAVGPDDLDPVPVSVRIEDGTVYVNNRRIEESYLTPDTAKTFSWSGKAELNAGQYYVMGDNRSVSKDSRIIGPVDDNKIIGKAVLRFWPLSRFGLLR